MKESDIKKRLVRLLGSEFEILDPIKGVAICTKQVRPDFGFKVCYSETETLFFVVEIKDDSAKNFNLSDLLRQAITYKFSQFQKGLIPDYVFVTTYGWLKEPKYYRYENCSQVLGLSNKLGIGVICLSQDNSIQFKIGSQILFEYKIDFGEFHWSLEKRRKLMIGTKSNTNKI